MSSNLEARTHSLLNELNFDKGGFFDLGHPLLNRIAESFIKAAGVRFSPDPISPIAFRAFLAKRTDSDAHGTTGCFFPILV